MKFLIHKIFLIFSLYSIGAGLGLFISYDIIKAHGSEIKLETKEGKGAEFIIELPVK